VIHHTIGDTAVENRPLVTSLRSISFKMDDQYVRERQSLIATLPNPGVKERALAMLESRHHQRRGNYFPELIALRELP